MNETEQRAEERPEVSTPGPQEENREESKKTTETEKKKKERQRRQQNKERQFLPLSLFESIYLLSLGTSTSYRWTQRRDDNKTNKKTSKNRRQQNKDNSLSLLTATSSPWAQRRDDNKKDSKISASSSSLTRIDDNKTSHQIYNQKRKQSEFHLLPSPHWLQRRGKTEKIGIERRETES